MLHLGVAAAGSGMCVTKVSALCFLRIVHGLLSAVHAIHVLPCALRSEGHMSQVSSM